jgi:N6-L-threonylcarbamoyladenine synthase
MEIIVEVAPFDIQKIKNPDIKGIEYQEGETKDFENIREYVFYRDNHTCQCCKGKSKDKVLQTHHIKSRQTGGDAPNNLIILCKTCHEGYHNGTVKLPSSIKRGVSFRDAAFMSIMRWAFYNKLKELYPNIKIKQTYGYITKANRIANNLLKEHRVDALCIESNDDIEPIDTYYYKRKVRCHNRQIHKSKILKGGKRKLNQAPFEVFGFRLFDKVFYKRQECFISGRRKTGYFKLIKLDRTVIHESAKYKDIKLINHSNSYLIERRENNYKRKEEADNRNS